MEEASLALQWEELGISDDFVFGKVMQDKTLCKELLELILGIKIKDIKYPESQKSVELYDDARGIRLDVYVDDDKGTVYNIEMQASNKDDIPKRSRYYGSLVDLNLLARKETYKKLKKCYIIFICKFDLFGKGRHIYTFENRCTEDTSVTLGDGAYRIFLNSKGIMDDVTPKQKAFLDYVENKVSADAFVQALAKKVKEVKLNKEWRREYMTLQMRDLINREEGIEIGIAQGRKEGIAQGRKEGVAQGRKEGVAQGRKEGVAQGRKEGVAQGVEIGVAQGLEKSILKILKKTNDVLQTADLFDVTVKEVEEIAKKNGLF